MLGKEKVIKLFAAIEDGEEIDSEPESILKSVEDMFNQLEIILRENFTNDLTENYEFFASVNKSFQRISNLCNQLLYTENLSSQTTAIVCQTKLWIKTGKKESQGLKKFIQTLLNISTSNNDVPHFKAVASNCLYEINLAFPDIDIKKSDDLMKYALNTNTRTYFPEFVQIIDPENKQLNKFLEQRFYGLSPFEKAVFSNPLLSSDNKLPNNALDLISSLRNGSITKEEVRSIVENPFTGFGMKQTVEEFPNSFDFTVDEIINDIDTRETAAAKSQMLKPVLSSIIDNPYIADFCKEESHSPICYNVFNLAARLSPSDVCQFFKKYFPGSEHLDEFWIELFEKQKESTRDTLLCFLSQFPKRKASVFLFLTYDANHSAPVIDNIEIDKSTIQLLSNPMKKGSSLASIFAKEKINRISENADEEEKAEIEKCLNYEDPIDLESSNVVSDVFSIGNVDIYTYNQTNTLIVLEIIPKKTDEAFIGVTFTASNSEYFDGDGSYTVPYMFEAVSVNIKMKAKKAGNTRLSITANYTTLEGKNYITKLQSVNVSTLQLLSPCEADFEMAWTAPQESRIFLNMKIDKFKTLLMNTVFGLRCNGDNSKVESVVTTPDGQLIALYGVQTNKGVVVSMKAPNIFFLSVIDGVLRTLM